MNDPFRSRRSGIRATSLSTASPPISEKLAIAASTLMSRTPLPISSYEATRKSPPPSDRAFSIRSGTTSTPMDLIPRSASARVSHPSPHPMSRMVCGSTLVTASRIAESVTRLRLSIFLPRTASVQGAAFACHASITCSSLNSLKGNLFQRAS